METALLTPSKTLESAFLAKYPGYDFLVESWKAANLCEFTWDNLTKVRLQSFVDYLSKRLAANSVNQYATKLKAVLNLYSDEVTLPKGYSKVLSPKKEKVQNVYLNESELQRFMNYSPRNNREALVQAQFALGVLTLARHSDFCHFDSSNIIDGKLTYVSQKTKIQASVPASPALLKFLEVQKRLLAKNITICENSFNDIIRRICMRCCIDDEIKIYHRGQMITQPKYMLVGSHTARRSGATNLYLRGLDLLTISKICGHTDTKTTLGYICCGIRELPQTAKDYFAAFTA